MLAPAVINQCMSMSDVQVVHDAEALAVAGARLFIEASRGRDRFAVALSGGTTPKRLYQLLAEQSSAIDWTKMHFFWSDERHVPPDHPDSNYHMAHEALLSKVPVPSENIHRIHAEFPDPTEAASDYEATLSNFFALGPGELPHFDLILLGLGPDAHTASIFPGSLEAINTDRLVLANWIEKLNTHRLTMTMPVINAAKVVVFLVSGAEKAEALKAVIDGPHDLLKYPAQAVAPTEGSLKWLVDEAASSLIR